MTREIPEIDDVELAFGQIKHLPEWGDIPAEFKNEANKYHRFISLWFHRGLTAEMIERISLKPDIDAKAAHRAIMAAMVSFQPKHERKLAGVAFLFSEWFELADEVHA